MLEIIRNKKGNGATLALFAAGMAGLMGSAMLSLSSSYLSSQGKSKGAAQARAENAFNLNLIVNRFRIENRSLPTWFPEPYPTQTQRYLSGESLPSLKIFRDINSEPKPKVIYAY